MPGVLIPFIAGQWSLPRRAHLARRRVRGFNSLHCGAVVASRGGGKEEKNMFHEFQSPSLRGSGRFPMRRPAASFSGSWFQSPSLRGSGRFPKGGGRSVCTSAPFQSPSLRGSGRFDPALHGVRLALACLNPLHCGAVVASSLRRPGSAPQRDVLIPFIAGQWSLPRAARLGDDLAEEFQSPSLRGSGRFI